MNGAERRKNLAAALMVIISYLLTLVYVAWNGRNLINSDVAGEMILSNILNQTGGIVTDRWHYSTELRVLNTQLVYKIGLRLFPHNWHAARTFSVGVFLFMILISAVLLMKAARLKRRYIFWICMLLLPFGQWYGWNVLFNSYYVPHLVITMVSLAMIINLAGNSFLRHPVVSLILTILLMLLGFGAGLGGVRQLMICYAPLTVAAMVMLLIRIYRNEKAGAADNERSAREAGSHKPFGKAGCAASRIQLAFSNASQEIRLLILSLAVLVCSYIGYKINVNVLAYRYSFSSFESMQYTDISFSRLMDILSALFQMFGWQRGAKIFSFRGFGNILAALAAVLLLWLNIRAVQSCRKMDFSKRVLLHFSSALFWVQLYFFATTDRYNESYWVLVLPFILLCALIGLIETTGRKMSGFFILCQAIWLLVCSVATMWHPYIDWVQDDQTIMPVAEWLDEQGYTQGYATFWNSDVLTELSDGRIEMWTVERLNDRSSVYRWLQATEHDTVQPEGEFFILVSQKDLDEKEEQEQLAVFSALPDHMVYQDENYQVYTFDSCGQYDQLVSSILASEDEPAE